MRKMSKFLLITISIMLILICTLTRSSFAVVTQVIDANGYVDLDEPNENDNSEKTPENTGNAGNNENTTGGSTAGENAEGNKNNNPSGKNDAEQGKSDTEKDDKKENNPTQTATTNHPQTGIFNSMKIITLAVVSITSLIITFKKLKKYNY